MEGLDRIEQRLRENLADQEARHYTRNMDVITRAFLDLILEYQDLEDFNRLTVLIPKVVLGWEASLYVVENEDTAVLVVSTRRDVMERCEQGELIQEEASLEIRRKNGDYLFPLRQGGSATPLVENPSQYPVVGVLRVGPEQELDENEVGFFKKYANLVGLSLTQRILARKNLQHLNFIRTLVADIGHNVIVPNIFFKAYLRRLAGKIKHLVGIQDQLVNLSKAPPQVLAYGLRDLSAEMANTNEGLLEEFDHIEKHYINTSLFLETLLRQSHFEKGRYVLQKKTCNFRRDIIEPQVERYMPRIKARGVEVDLSAGGVPDEEIEAVVDVGLISQVFANFLSNAIKYTRPVLIDGRERKFIAYGLELCADAFGPGEDGVKINLFSTGQPLEMAEHEAIFQEGRRGSNVESERGTGHGLFFVKEVIELHRGRVGYEPSPAGNNFYFILPR